MKFTIENPDYNRSPLTGMTRDHWLQCAKFLVDGVFQNLSGLTDPISIPKQSEVTYPQPDDPEHRFQAARFEGLARTFMAAAPVIAGEPSFSSHGLNVRDYYAHHVLQASDPDSKHFVGYLSEIIKEHGKKQYQQTVELLAGSPPYSLSPQAFRLEHPVGNIDWRAAFLSDLSGHHGDAGILG